MFNILTIKSFCKAKKYKIEEVFHCSDVVVLGFQLFVIVQIYRMKR